jgi:hypothetical protein
VFLPAFPFGAWQVDGLYEHAGDATPSPGISAPKQVSFLASSVRQRARLSRRQTMNKLTMFVLAALAAATVGTGALAAAPSSSASTPQEPKTRLPLLRFHLGTVFTTKVGG